MAPHSSLLTALFLQAQQMELRMGARGGSAAGCHLTEERTRLEGDTTARRSEERSSHNDPHRESGSRPPDDEHLTESFVQERIMVDSEELQAPHRLTSRDLVHLDEDTAGVSSRPAIGLRTAGAMLNPVHGNTAGIAAVLQAQPAANNGMIHDDDTAHLICRYLNTSASSPRHLRSDLSFTPTQFRAVQYRFNRSPHRPLEAP
jgi:hypothetical protein